MAVSLALAALTRTSTFLPAALFWALCVSPPCALAAASPAPAAADPAFTTTARPAASAALSAADLDRLEREMLTADSSRRLAAAQAVATAGPEGYSAYVERLRRPLFASTEVLRALIHGIWAQYPNPDYPKGPGNDPSMWFTRPEPRWVPPPRVKGQPRARRPPQHDPDAVDWQAALAQLDLATEEMTLTLTLVKGQPPAEIAAARADALLRVSLMRAIAAAGRSGRRDAVYPLFEFAFVREGLFRDECGRMIRSMDSYAVPALVRTYNDRTRSNAKMRRYASYQLDRMDRLRPNKAIATAPDDITRADIIHAYGEARALDAVEAVLKQVDAASHRVRREARWTWMRYVDGPPPPPAPKRKRKLPGGQEEAEEKEDYLNYREMATLEIARTLKEISGQVPDPRLSAKDMTTQLFSIFDQRREEEFARLFESAQQKERGGDLRGAVDEFSWILANQPDHPRRVEMAGAYRRLGEVLIGVRGLTQKERSARHATQSRGLGLLRQAVALDPAMPEARRIMAEVHLLDGEQAEEAGADGQADYVLAMEADPSLPGVAAALHRAQGRMQRKEMGLLPILAGLLCLTGGLVLVLWRRRSADPTSEHGGAAT